MTYVPIVVKKIAPNSREANIIGISNLIKFLLILFLVR
jgi:hypothetical protein